MSRPTTEENQGSGTREGLRTALGFRDRLVEALRRVPPARECALMYAYARFGKKSAISRAADSGPSEPWTRFSVVSSARSPRIVPGAASLGFVAPMILRTTCHVFSPPSITIATSGPRVMNATRSPKNGFPVLLVVAAGEVGVDGAQLHRDDR